MKCPFLRGVPWTMSSETLKSRSFVRKFSMKPPGGAYFFQALLRGGLKERGKGLIQFSEMYQWEQGFSRTDLWLPGAILLFLTIRKW